MDICRLLFFLLDCFTASQFAMTQLGYNEAAGLFPPIHLIAVVAALRILQIL
jgi:hypothetical protein